jgi:hypothetical protein
MTNVKAYCLLGKEEYERLKQRQRTTTAASTVTRDLFIDNENQQTDRTVISKPSKELFIQHLQKNPDIVRWNLTTGRVSLFNKEVNLYITELISLLLQNQQVSHPLTVKLRSALIALRFPSSLVQNREIASEL